MISTTKRIQRRISAYASQQRRIERQINLLAVLRMVVFLTLIFGASLLFGETTLQVGALIGMASIALFLFLMVRHDRCYRFKTQCQTLQHILKQDLARAEYRLKDIQVDHPIEFESGHPFAYDLDLVGRHPVLNLVDDSHHLGAKRWLKHWVDEIQSAEGVTNRQNAVQALAPRKRFRLKLSLAARLDSHADLDPQQFQEWLETPVPWTLKTGAYLIGRAWTLLTLASLFTRFVLGSQALPWVWILLVQVIIFYSFDYIHRKFFLGFLEHGRALRAAAAVITPFQSLRTDAGRLRAIQEKLGSDGSGAGQQLSQLIGIYDQLAFRQNGFAHFLLNTLFLWDQVQLRRLRAWRDAHGKDLELWLEAMFEVEALASVANFAWVFPNHIYPDTIDRAELLIQSEAMGHPAIQEGARVGNDFSIDGGGQIHLITGSNMSGKSTFLRTIGVNLILTRLGAPVCAKTFKTNQPQLWTSIRIQDSLAEGVSYFYAEVMRLKALLEAVAKGGRSLFFLLDEILKGTNSRERLIACKALVQYLIEHGASGLITTHDLELLALAESHSDAITKFHFQENIRDEAMFFDYRLKPGELTSTNALRVMHFAGVPLNFESNETSPVQKSQEEP